MIHLSLLKLVSNLYIKMFLKYGERVRIRWFYLNDFLKFSYLRVYQVKHLVKIFQKRFPRFQYNFHLMFNKHESFLFFKNGLIFLNLLENFFSGLARKLCICLEEFLSLKENIRNFGSSFQDKSVSLICFTFRRL